MYSDVRDNVYGRNRRHNAQTLRRDADVSLENLALAMQRYGLSWSTGRVGDFKRAGRANLATMLTVAAALGDVIGRPVTVAELFAGKGPVAIDRPTECPSAGAAGGAVRRTVSSETDDTRRDWNTVGPGCALPKVGAGGGR